MGVGRGAKEKVYATLLQRVSTTTVGEIASAGWISLQGAKEGSITMQGETLRAMMEGNPRPIKRLCVHGGLMSVDFSGRQLLFITMANLLARHTFVLCRPIKLQPGLHKIDWL